MNDTPHRWRTYVAIGDSFSEGMSDADPRQEGRYVGWADRLAGELSTRVPDGGFRYANLAIRGRKLDDVVGPQLEAALSMGPDLVSVV
ncbi:MAG: G-D-S-L family lipolytic protein, partial [Kytococcus sp.]|nr:G-D-S-L family lipolytic protein [Kytococcus sp.]